MHALAFVLPAPHLYRCHAADSMCGCYVQLRFDEAFDEEEQQQAQQPVSEFACA
jgi:hypothetical protein